MSAPLESADSSPRDVTSRLRAAAPPAPACAAEVGVLAANVMSELRQRKVRRKARASGLGALLLLVGATAWWAHSSRDEAAANATKIAARVPTNVPQAAESSETLAALRERIAAQRRLVESLERVDRCAEYERKLAATESIEDPLRPARLELERAAWLMLDGVERRAVQGATRDGLAGGYARVAEDMAGTYWARVAEDRRKQLLVGTGT